MKVHPSLHSSSSLKPKFERIPWERIHVVRDFFSLSETTNPDFLFTFLWTSDCKVTKAGHFPAEAAQPFPPSQQFFAGFSWCWSPEQLHAVLCFMGSRHISQLGGFTAQGSTGVGNRSQLHSRLSRRPELLWKFYWTRQLTLDTHHKQLT